MNLPTYVDGQSNRGYRMAKKVSFVNTIICVATHSGSHSSHGLTSHKYGHINKGYCTS